VEIKEWDIIKKYKKPFFYGLVEEFVSPKNRYAKGFLLKYFTFKEQIKKIRKIINNNNIKIGIVLHNKKMINYLRQIKIENLKIFEVKKI